MPALSWADGNATCAFAKRPDDFVSDGPYDRSWFPVQAPHSTVSPLCRLAAMSVAPRQHTWLAATDHQDCALPRARSSSSLRKLRHDIFLGRSQAHPSAPSAAIRLTPIIQGAFTCSEAHQLYYTVARKQRVVRRSSPEISHPGDLPDSGVFSQMYAILIILTHLLFQPPP